MGALEAIKVLAGFGETLEKRVLHFDLRQMSFNEVALNPREDCKICGK
jgi:molybdopterin/thiamine biosynthesis adenylyltransferase